MQGLRKGLAPLVLYLVVSILVVGHGVLGDFANTTIGSGPDPAAFVWIIKWWPQAIANGWDPLHTHVAYAPDGFNMTWVTSIPGPSLVLAPLTALAGPIVSYNVLVILIPALNGWAAFFLCRGVGSNYPASVLGGYVYGFSSYVLGQVAGHPHTALIAALPLGVLLAVRFQQRKISPAWFVIALSAVLTAQFLISVEVFLTSAIFSIAAVALSMLLFRAARGRLLEMAKWALGAYLITAVVVSPYLYANLSQPDTLAAINPLAFATDPVGLVVPSRLVAIGGGQFESISSRFAAEQGAYLGVLLLALTGILAWQRRSDRVVRLLLLVLAFGFVASLGARLELLGQVTQVRLPWAPFIHLPITKYVIPSRMILYAWLALALLLALGLSALGGRLRWALALGGAVLLLPATGLSSPVDGKPFWSSRRQVPAFFRSAELRASLPGRGTTLVLPYGVADDGESMIWQAEAGMGFAMPDGYLSAVVPPNFACWPLDGALRSSVYEPGQRHEFLEFLAAKQVRAVVVSAAVNRDARPLLSALRTAPRRSGGVLIYPVSASVASRVAGPCPGNSE